MIPIETPDKAFTGLKLEGRFFKPKKDPKIFPLRLGYLHDFEIRMGEMTAKRIGLFPLFDKKVNIEFFANGEVVGEMFDRLNMPLLKELYVVLNVMDETTTDVLFSKRRMNTRVLQNLRIWVIKKKGERVSIVKGLSTVYVINAKTVYLGEVSVAQGLLVDEREEEIWVGVNDNEVYRASLATFNGDRLVRIPVIGLKELEYLWSLKERRG